MVYDCNMVMEDSSKTYVMEWKSFPYGGEQINVVGGMGWGWVGVLCGGGMIPMFAHWYILCMYVCIV